MAFENGNNVFSYSQEIFEKYKNDNFVFMKALQTIQYFQTRPDYPYSIKELDEAILKILGQSLTEMSFSSRKYAIMDSDQIEWDATKVLNCEEEGMYEVSLVADVNEADVNVLVDNFKNEFLSFCYTLSPVFDSIFLMEDSPMRLSRMTISEPLASKESIMRLIRNDGETLDLMVDKNDIQFIIRTLEEKIK